MNRPLWKSKRVIHKLFHICNSLTSATPWVRYPRVIYQRFASANYYDRSESLLRKYDGIATVANAKPLPRLNPNYKKILEAVLFLINEAQRRNLYVTEYDIVKSIFLADVSHLNQHARPITFDNFVAMEHGPVPSATRNLLQPDFNSRVYFSEAWPPWDRERSPADGDNAYKFVHPKRRENSRILSETDVNALSEALSVVKSLKFSGVRDETHKHPAYIEAWGRRGERKASDMDYTKLLDVDDGDIIEDLVYSSKHT